MIEAIETWVRYELPDEKGETRRERNKRFDQPNPPEFEIPDEGQYLWLWYHQISEGVRRINDGVCYPLSWNDFSEWIALTGQSLMREEIDILRAVDVAFCSEMNKELQAYQDRQRAAFEAEQKAAGRKK